MQLDNLSAFPELIIGKLDQWSVTQVSGEDRASYLNGQLSCDILNLKAGQQSLAAHCDAKGKTWSVLRVLATADAFWLLQKRSAQQVQQPELLKYSVFAKASIETAEALQVVAVIGQQARHFISETFGEQIAMQGGEIPSGFCIHYPEQSMRYLLVLDETQSEVKLPYTEQAFDINQVWDGLDIAAGIPSLEQATSHQFIPQALNLHCLDAISFSKGCFSGQEVIARAKYRGTNKRATLRFAGQSGFEVKAGTDLEIKMGENWRRCGTVLSYFHQSNGHTELLAVVPIDADPSASYRVHGQESGVLTLAHLPYALADE